MKLVFKRISVPLVCELYASLNFNLAHFKLLLKCYGNYYGPNFVIVAFSFELEHENPQSIKQSQ